MVSEDLQRRDPDGHAEEPGPVQTEDLRLTQVQGFFCFDCRTFVCLEAMLRILISNPYPYSSFIYICKLLSREQVRIRFNELHSAHFMENVLNVCVCLCRVMQQALNYINTAISHAHSWKLIKPHMLQIIQVRPLSNELANYNE